MSTTGATVEDFISEFDNLFSRVDKEIIEEIKKDKPSKSTRTEDEDSHSRTARRFLPYANPDPPNRDFRQPFNRFDPLRDIGRGDLNPLGGGGGMILDPIRFNPPIGRLPPGHPPGARFDPINPLLGGRMDPDNDHFRPPGPPPDGYDDMFM